MKPGLQKAFPGNQKEIPSNYEGAHVMDPLKTEALAVLLVGDKGFCTDKLREELERAGHRHCVPGKSNRRKVIRNSKRLYRIRYRVEDYFRRLKRRACACTRCDKLALHSLSPVQFASVADSMR